MLDGLATCHLLWPQQLSVVTVRVEPFREQDTKRGNSLKIKKSFKKQTAAFQAPRSAMFSNTQGVCGCECECERERECACV